MQNEKNLIAIGSRESFYKHFILLSSKQSFQCG